MAKDYSNRNCRKESFRNEDLMNARFNQSDLRGADFSGSDLSGASFINVKTGITPFNIFLISFTALLVSAFAGYIATLAGDTVQVMLASQDPKIKITGVATLVIVALFIAYSYWKGGLNALRYLMAPIFFFSIIVGGVSYISGAGTGKGMLYELLALLLVVVMFIVGTISRVIAGSLSNILFVVVAIAGSVFSKTMGGGIGTVVMAISCALISKRALSGASGFETVRKLAAFFTSKFGTSFRNCSFRDADFSSTKTIWNADFSDSDTSSVYWGDSRKKNCIL